MWTMRIFCLNNETWVDERLEKLRSYFIPNMCEVKTEIHDYIWKVWYRCECCSLCMLYNNFCCVQCYMCIVHGATRIKSTLWNSRSLFALTPIVGLWILHKRTKKKKSAICLNANYHLFCHFFFFIYKCLFLCWWYGGEDMFVSFQTCV